ncbi:hypothetical protein [Marinicrinis sediminis]|uniref:Uncharacterized protein n=1 Tax=Marinicrinis sediminis TaxID=1652465 RepID=A0ABW5RD69_9BACL
MTRTDGTRVTQKSTEQMDVQEQQETASGQRTSSLAITSPWVQALLTLEEETACKQLGEQMTEAGFAAVREWLDDLRVQLKRFEEHDMDRMAAILHRAQLALPHPEKISPSWQSIWQEYTTILQSKIQLLKQFPSQVRTGEWQVLMDNPYTQQGIVCYPSLTFMDAIYLFAYFRAELHPNEYIRLQRIETVWTEQGGH